MFGERLAKHAATVETQLDQAMAPMGDTPVVQGMRYALRGGKRLRAFLVMQSAAIYDLPHSQSIWPAAAIEAIGTQDGPTRTPKAYVQVILRKSEPGRGGH